MLVCPTRPGPFLASLFPLSMIDKMVSVQPYTFPNSPFSQESGSTNSTREPPDPLTSYRSGMRGHPFVLLGLSPGNCSVSTAVACLSH